MKKNPSDITREEAEQFNDDVQCVIERLIEFDVIQRYEETEQNTVLAASAIVRQLMLRWYDVDYSLAEIERLRELRSLIRDWNALKGSSQPLP